ncbi:MAG: glycosyltransferase [Flavobacteriales bacterium]|nr:glycosyltransferase [Flavobacteriales bacterium]NNK81210.1 glycosyltransferase [Flavobacteriales bacterium]
MVELDSRLHIVVATYNGARWIEKCLDSILNSSVKTKTWIIDNNSEDETVQLIKNHPLRPELVVMKTNLGFGKANNIGVSRALNDGAEIVFLLNQDAYLYSDTLQKMVEFHSSDSSFGILSPIHLDGMGDKLDYNFGRYYTDFRASSSLMTDALRRQLKSVYRLPFVNAAAWFIPRQTFEKIGGFDPLFSHYGEDDNFCQRLHFHGMQLGLVTDCFIRHDRGERDHTKPKLFSELELKVFERKLKVRYADPSNPAFPEKYDEEMSNFLKWSNRNRIKMNSHSAKGYKLKADIMKSLYQAIRDSRSKTSSAGAHYLDI